MNDKFNPADYTFSPQEAVTQAIEDIQIIRANKHRALPPGIPGTDGYIAPYLPGELIGILAQTSHGKSATLASIRNRHNEHLNENGRGHEILVHVDLETPVEHLIDLEIAALSNEEAGDLARGEVKEWNGLEVAALQVGEMNVHFVGSSLGRPQFESDLHMTNIIRCLQYLAKEKYAEPKQIAAVYIDYLQALPFDPDMKSSKGDEQRRMQVRRDFFRMRDGARYYGCPIFVGIQAKQGIGAEKNHYVPGLYDGEETSAIAQRADRLISQWMPKQSEGVMAKIESKYGHYRALENLMWLRVLKQRGRLPSGKQWPYLLNFKRNTMEQTDMETVKHLSAMAEQSFTPHHAEDL